MNLSDEQMLELANKATGKEWMIVTYPNGGGIGYVVLKSDPDKVLWKPSLDGEEWQQAQALRVIRAADSGRFQYGFRAKLYHHLLSNSDILSCAIMMLLAKTEPLKAPDDDIPESYFEEGNAS